MKPDVLLQIFFTGIVIGTVFTSVIYGYFFLNRYKELGFMKKYYEQLCEKKRQEIAKWEIAHPKKKVIPQVVPIPPHVSETYKPYGWREDLWKTKKL